MPKFSQPIGNDSTGQDRGVDDLENLVQHLPGQFLLGSLVEYDGCPDEIGFPKAETLGEALFEIGFGIVGFR